MRKTFPAVLAATLLLAACTDTATPATTNASVPPPPVGTTSRAETTTTTAPPSPTSVPPPPTTPATTIPPATTTTAADPAPRCPDLERDTGAGAAELALFRDTGAAIWTAPLGGRRVADSILTGGVAYVAFEDGLAVALAASTCAEIWRIQRASPLIDLAIDDDRLIVADATAVTSVDRAGGVAIWELPWSPAGTAPQVLRSPAGILLVPDVGAGQLLALAADGSVIWQAPMPAGRLVGLTAADDVVVVVTDTTAVAREAATGSRRWTVAVDVAGLLAPTFQGGTLYLTGGSALVAMDPGDGATRWRRTAEGAARFVSSPQLDHNEIHILDSEGRLHHLRRADGTSLATGLYPAGRTSAAFDDRLVLAAADGTVAADNLLQVRRWAIPTGADGVERVTTVDVDGDSILAYTSPSGG